MFRCTVLAVIAIPLAGLFQGCAEETPRLAMGEMRLPSGAVVKGGEPTGSTAETINHILRGNFSDDATTTPEQAQYAIKRLSEFKDYAIKLAVINSSEDTKLSAICDEYVSSVLQITARMSPSLTKFIIHIETKYLPQPHICEYKIENGLFLKNDGSPVPKAQPTFEIIRSGSSAELTVAAFSMTQTPLVPFPVQDVLIPSLFVGSDVAKLASSLKQGAVQLYGKSRYQNKIIRFLAVQGDTLHYFKLPPYVVMAIKGPENNIVLVEDIKYQTTMLISKDGGDSIVRNFVIIQALDSKLIQALASGNADEAYKAYMRDGLHEYAAEIVETAGKYAADAFNVSEIIVNFRAKIPSSGFGINIPVTFTRDNGTWSIIKNSNPDNGREKI
jgi:hypothetical protein